MTRKAESASDVVLALMANPDQLHAKLLSLWDRMHDLGWLEKADSRIVLQVGQAQRSALVLETTRSLADLLRELSPRAEIQIIDPGAQASEWEPFQLVADAADPVTVSAVTAPAQLRVPKLWLEAYFLVTIAGAGPSREGRVSGILEAQGEPLRRLALGFCPQATVVFEGHRLAASDLCVLCGNRSFGQRSSPVWWLASSRDIAVEQVLSLATGSTPGDLASLRAVARHEITTSTPVIEGKLNKLEDYMAPAWVARYHMLKSQICFSYQRFTRDVSLAKRNLHKMPQFIRKRLVQTRAKKQGL